MCKDMIRAFILALLVFTLAFPLSAMAVLANPQAPAGQQQQQEPQKPPEVAISVEVPIVTVDVVAATQHGDIITGLKKENFRILEDGVPQTITNFAPSDAPITMVMLLEFSKVGGGYFAYQARYWADGFFRNLNQKDWVALRVFDLRVQQEVDFTQNKEEVRDAIYHLYFPGFSEANLFDVLLDTLDRLKDVRGKKSILILASGLDTFSKHTLDQTLKALRQTDVTIFAVGLGKAIIDYFDARGQISASSRLSFYQAENQLRSFANMTGGYAWFPQFDGEIPGIFQQVAAYLRNQYSLAYTPANRVRDGKFHKIKIELVQPDGTPLVVQDQKGKKLKYVVYAREGYTAPKGDVGD